MELRIGASPLGLGRMAGFKRRNKGADGYDRRGLTPRGSFNSPAFARMVG
ncbi:hypothetical protein TR2A62_1452 [Thalassobium sp. R2A62]|nr:hypothetical protein TR2A62_1452 [Thalassobium sp. R2A62]